MCIELMIFRIAYILNIRMTGGRVGFELHVSDVRNREIFFVVVENITIFNHMYIIRFIYSMNNIGSRM